MPKYLYECSRCGSSYARYKRIQNIDVPEFCSCTEKPMKRIFSASFQIIAEREADKRENQLYKILTKGSGKSDELALMREDGARMERTMEAMPETPKEWTTEDTLGTGILQAAQSGPQGIQNWRDAHIPPEKQYAKDEVIGL